MMSCWWPAGGAIRVAVRPSDRHDEAMGRRAVGWAWFKVNRIHDSRPGSVTCGSEIHSYRYRYYAAPSGSYERCVALAWCPVCREYSAAMVYVPRDEHLPDLLAGLAASQREQLARSEPKLLDYLDRLVRRGVWPSAEPGHS